MFIVINMNIYVYPTAKLTWASRLPQIAMAYEARSHFPDKKIHITNEIIHNPEVSVLS